MSDRLQIVTIDGPAGVGKSTVSRRIALALGYTYLDTGAMYRGVAVHLQQLAVSPQDQNALAAALDGLHLELLPAVQEGDEIGVLLGDQDISHLIRTPEISMAASSISALAPVREKLTLLQRRIGSRGRIVAEGRDMGTVVFPKAAYKFFLDATPEIRAHRRVLQLQAKGEVVDEQTILRQTIERDRNDRERTIAPLKPADDAILIDTTEIGKEEVLQRILKQIHN